MLNTLRLSLLTALLLAAALPAQNPPDLPKKPRGSNHGRLDLPSSKPAPSQEEPEDENKQEQPVELPPLWAEPSCPADEVFLAFELEATTSLKAREDALNQLRMLGLGTRETAVKALTSPWIPSVLLAAELLLEVGTDDDVDLLVAAASQTPSTDAVRACLDSAARLAGGWLPKTALNLLEHPRKPVRSLVESRLQQAPHESHLPALLRYLRFGRDQDVRLRAVRLLGASSENPDALRALRESLNGAKPTLAFAIVQVLAGDAYPAQVDVLRQSILKMQPSVEFAYLLHGLLLQQKELDILLVTDELADHIKPGLESSDLFVSGATAAALAEWAYRSDHVFSGDEFESLLAHRLVRAVDGDRFYPQYARFSPLAEATLRRITGEAFPDQSRQAWLEWWLVHGESFRMVRGQLGFADSDFPYLKVTWVRSGSSRTLAGVAVAGNSGAIRWLPLPALQRLAWVLKSSELLTDKVHPGSYGMLTDPTRLELELAIGNRTKRLIFRGEATASYLPSLLDSLEVLWAEQAWQSLAAHDGREFVMEHLGDMPANPEDWANWYLQLGRGRLTTLDTDGFATWLQALVLNAHSGGLLQPADVEALFQQLPLRKAHPELCLSIIDLVSKAPSFQLPALCDALSTLEPALRKDFLMHAFSSYPDDKVAATLAQDPRVWVRVLAARSLETASSAVQSDLLSALQDESALVVRATIRTLGIRAEPASLPALLPFADETNEQDLRIEALHALGVLCSDEALPTLLAALKDPAPGVQAAAMQSISKLSSLEAQQSFASLFVDYAQTPMESVYLRSLHAWGAASTRGVLRQFLGHEDEGVRKAAVYHLMPLGDPAVASVLMEQLKQDSRNAELLDGLASVLCVDFRNMPSPSGVYEAWWESSFLLDSSAWFMRGAQDAGFQLPADLFDPNITSPKDAVAALLPVLERGPAHLRGATSYHLHRLSGVDGPVFLPAMHSAVVRRGSQVWHDWLKR